MGAGGAPFSHGRLCVFQVRKGWHGVGCASRSLCHEVDAQAWQSMAMGSLTMCGSISPGACSQHTLGPTSSTARPAAPPSPPTTVQTHPAGLEINPDRPHSKLPYRGAWLWIGPEMIHLMELPNPDPMSGRPEVRTANASRCVRGWG